MLNNNEHINTYIINIYIYIYYKEHDIQNNIYIHMQRAYYT